MSSWHTGDEPSPELPNRRRLSADLADVFTTQAGRACLAIVRDLNGFKGYNDAFGHVEGDLLLQPECAPGRALPAGGTAYRLGGDEFCVLLDDDRPTPTGSSRCVERP